MWLVMFSVPSAMFLSKPPKNAPLLVPATSDVERTASRKTRDEARKQAAGQLLG